MSNHISAAKAAIREDAREPGGQFGFPVKGVPPADTLTHRPERPKPIMVTAHEEVWDERGKVILKTLETKFDASHLMARMTPKAREDLHDSTDAREDLFIAAVAAGLAEDHEGTVTVEVSDALSEALAENPAYFDNPESIPRPPRIPEAILTSPLTPFELGARMDPDSGIVSGRAVFLVSDLIADTQKQHDEVVSERLVGYGYAMEDPEVKAVGVTSRGEIIMEMRGWAGDIYAEMSEEGMAEFEAGAASRAEQL